ncbi:hypothetical protein POTOM_059560 [Populus tomentosa]|uniref:Late embryogenesis abundant protein LEA-2 subgroup domain-containing protein n=1 Tax=Populus tomentosa TaxID=118781 RepID=A0A8X8C371_POPTO|nr:hypothetical protein POTOM_059560 [Populus tomentosa]
MNTTTTLVHETITKTFSSGLKGYQPLDRYDDPHDMGYRSARAKKRQVFLKSYRLASRTELRRRWSRSLKLKKVVVKVRMAVLSAVSFMRGNALKSCNSKSSISASSPMQLSNPIQSQVPIFFINFIAPYACGSCSVYSYSVSRQVCKIPGDWRWTFQTVISFGSGAKFSKKVPCLLSNSKFKILRRKGKGLFFLLLLSCMDYAQRRVHPSDVEAAMETAPAYPSKYVMLNNNNSSSVRPPPKRRNIPSLLAVLYVTLDPKTPQYNIESFEVNAFNMAPDFSLYTEFVVVVKANNPNKEIAFTYGKDSSVVVAYSDSTLCSGKIPAFHQPFDNTTMIRVVLTGKSEFGSGLQEALMDNRETGRIPLLVIVKAPISVMVKSLALRQVMVNVNCSLVVDNLAPNKRVRILSSTYTYAFEEMKSEEFVLQAILCRLLIIKQVYVMQL